MNGNGDRSVKAGGNIAGSIIQTGDKNVAKLTMTRLPPAAEVDIHAVFAELRALLAGSGGEDSRKVANALDDAGAELTKAEPDKAEVAGLFTRALKIVDKAGELSDKLEKITPLVTSIAGWIGSAAHYAPLLAAIGLSAT